MSDRRLILYVEDDDAAFFLATLVLQDEAPCIELLRASDGEQALAMLHGFGPYEGAPKPDLILLDLNLPKKGGFEVLSDLKASESLCSIPVVMFSTSRSGKDMSTSQILGASDYITKPTNFEAFVQALRKACSLPPKTREQPS